MTPPAALISSTASVDAHHRVFAERPEKPGARRQMAETNGVGLAAHDGGKSERAYRRRGRGALERVDDDDGLPANDPWFLLEEWGGRSSARGGRSENVQVRSQL